MSNDRVVYNNEQIEIMNILTRKLASQENLTCDERLRLSMFLCDLRGAVERENRRLE